MWVWRTGLFGCTKNEIWDRYYFYPLADFEASVDTFLFGEWADEVDES